MRAIEFIIIIGLIVWQFHVFLENRRAIKKLKNSYPPPDLLSIYTLENSNIKYELITDPDPHEFPAFEKIVKDTNKYLLNNKGAAADLNLLKDISESSAESLDEKIQAQIATPLYLGLLGTFLGAILGLIPIIPDEKSASIQNEDLGNFLTGILIAMVGSFMGLLLTLRGNQLLKDARAQRNEYKNDYYTFLRTSLLPKLNTDMQTSMGSLKAVLDTFNNDFFGKIQNDFFKQIAQFVPLIGQLTKNIAVQKDFLVKVDEIGITKLANASVKVWDRVDQSAHHFEKFLGYQEVLNGSLAKATHSVELISKMLDRLGSLEDALRATPYYLEKHDETLRQWVQFFTQHNKILDDVSAGMQQSVQEAGSKLEGLMKGREKQFEAESQEAYEKWRVHFQRLHDDNIYQKIVDFLHPFQNLPEQQANLNKIQEAQAKKMSFVLDKLGERLDSDAKIMERLEDTSKLLVTEITRPNWFIRLVKPQSKSQLNVPKRHNGNAS